MPREVVTQGERITAAPVAHGEIPFEVGTPDLIRPGAVQKRFGIRDDSVAMLPRPQQTGMLEDGSSRRIVRPRYLWLLKVQPVHHLFDPTLLRRQFLCNNHQAKLLSGLIWVRVRRPRQFRQLLDGSRTIVGNPFVRRGATNPINVKKLTFGVIPAQPIGRQLQSLIHRTGFFPCPRQVPSCRSSVNHVLGLFCKPSCWFVPRSDKESQHQDLVTLQGLSDNDWRLLR